MSLFGSKKKTYVSSVVYNLAGDEADRPDFLKSLLIGDTLYGVENRSASLRNSLINRPGMRIRRFGDWSQGDYTDAIGSLSSRLSSPDSFDLDVLKAQIETIGSYDDIEIQKALMDGADIGWWADDWMLRNHPSDALTEWTMGYASDTNTVTITLVDGVTTYTFNPVGYDASGEYVYAAFNTREVINHPADPGDPEAEPPVPPTAAWTETILGPLEIFIYLIGSGNAALDAFPQQNTIDSFFLPVIPIRIDGNFVGPDKDLWAPTGLPEDATEEQISDAFKANKENFPVDTLAVNHPDLYPLVKRGAKKALGARYDKIVDSLAANPSLEDLDYAYAVFGVSLNTKDKHALLYVYRLFKQVYDSMPPPMDMDEYSQAIDDYIASMNIWKAWVDGGKVGPEPYRMPVPTMNPNHITISADGSADLNYDVTISWGHLDYDQGTGLGRAGAKVGDLWWVVGESIEFEEVLHNESVETMLNLTSVDRVSLFYQETATSWRALSFWDLTHTNRVHDSGDVVLKARNVLLDLDEDGDPIPYEESGFIVPLHQATYKGMPLLKSTQMAASCCYVVINCYTVVKKKWYQRGAFKFLLIVVIVVISIMLPGSGAAAGGILGTNASVGMAVGLTGAAAVLVGGIVNAIAAMIVSKLVGLVSVELFGEKWGAVISAIAAFVAFNFGATLASGGSTTAAFSELLRADNILAMTNAVGQGIQGYVAGTLNEIQTGLAERTRDYNESMANLDNLYAENIGSGRANLDPMGMIRHNSYLPESLDTFLSRTLMTGSDVAEMSLDFITNFADLSISTDLP